MKNLKLKSVAYLIVLLTLFSSCRKEDFGPDADQTTIQNGESEIGGEITLYEVKGDKITVVKDYEVNGADRDFQNDRDKHQQIWDLVTKIVPLSHRHKMDKFLIYSGNSSQTAGFVDPTSNDLSTWRMGIAIDYAYEGGFNVNKDLSYTIIHEFGHILTLNNEQVNAGTAEQDCNGFFIQEGCAKSGSYLHTNYTRFWADIYPEFRDEHNEGQTRMGQFYRKYEDRFVTEYAATNLVEDFAEVFAFFVTKDNRPSPNTIADKKVLMLYEFPELVKLRNEIRSNGGTRSSGGINILPEPGKWKSVHRH
ncbi:MAG: hypothetical protein GQ574_01675 [Crocinitomix sp.]|nr:hypothetical protein [Crocinitomix sp.]